MKLSALTNLGSHKEQAKALDYYTKRKNILLEYKKQKRGQYIKTIGKGIVILGLGYTIYAGTQNILESMQNPLPARSKTNQTTEESNNKLVLSLILGISLTTPLLYLTTKSQISMQKEQKKQLETKLEKLKQQIDLNSEHLNTLDTMVQKKI